MLVVDGVGAGPGAKDVTDLRVGVLAGARQGRMEAVRYITNQSPGNRG